MKHITLILISVLLTSCASTQDAYQQANALNYEAEPQRSDILTNAAPIIKAQLKDPDSLKNLTIAASYKCYASNMKVTDNISPKFNYGYWCYDFSYQATNSYGGYVTGKSIAVYYQNKLHMVNALGETIRKFDNVNIWHSPI